MRLDSRFMSSRDPERYDSPLVERYAGEEMVRLFSPRERVRTWRRLWIALAEAERELGLPIAPDQVQELRAKADEIDLDRAAEIERRLRHDVMAHVRLYGEQCPRAKPIIHLGATSAYVTDNADLILMREGLTIVRGLLLRAMRLLAEFAARERARPCLAFTHLQPAQLTTVGKRAALWLADFLIDYHELARLADELPFHGVKGTTGTQASFLALFDGDHAKVRKLERLVAAQMGFAKIVPVSGQTYPRKIDHVVLALLAGIATSASKMANDVRLLQGMGEIEEPFEAEQVGSSAMAYKRNPMRSERVSSLARFVMTTAMNAPLTAAAQWLERTLDDSAVRRLAIPESFLGVDAILRIVANVVQGLVVYPRVIAANVARELPFMATEDVLMAGVRAGGDRQDLHERVRVHAMEARRRVREEGAAPDLLERIAKDPAFAAIAAEVPAILDPARYTGRAAAQVEEFLEEEVRPVLARDAASEAQGAAELRV
jgi:adenylosuccinate lyase